MKKKGRPTKPVGTTLRQRSVRFDARTWADIEAYCEQKGIEDYSEAIRQLVREALGGIYRVS